MKKIILGIIILLVAGFIILQLVPYGRNHADPAVVAEPNWDSPQTRELASRACFDCHSNETVWPWYSNIAPVSWLVQHDVDEGRSRLNFSEWGTGRFDEPWEIGEAISRGQMPPSKYTAMHPYARLTQTEKQSLIDGFQATFRQ
ncbi:MAG: heme-binding domain-containing protein [Anaerolineales bacterium]|jgi:mono/diheme cytochrome c family protein